MQWVLYVDMDAFYVSCELRRRPELKGHPVIVGHRPTEGPTRAVVLSASYEARAFGVRSAQPVLEAVRRCPDAKWVPPDFERYEQVSHEVRRWLETRFSTVSPHSIDEASVVIDAEDVDAATGVARSAQRDLTSDLNLPSSWGVATHRLVAKIATDQAKPAGVVGVAPDHVAEFLAPLPLRAIPGVGPKTAEVLAKMGMNSIGDLAKRQPRELRGALGSWGASLVAIARGAPPPEVEEPSGPRSRSTDLTFDVDVHDERLLDEEASRLATELGAALEKEGLAYAGVGIGIRWSDFERVQRSRALPGVTWGSTPLVTTGRKLLRELLSDERAGRDRSVRTVTLRAERVTPIPGGQSRLDEF